MERDQGYLFRFSLNDKNIVKTMGLKRSDREVKSENVEGSPKDWTA